MLVAALTENILGPFLAMSDCVGDTRDSKFMPKFFFDTSGGAKSFTDASGLDFACVADASAHAMTLLPVMGVELPLKPGEFRTWTVAVRDADGDVVRRFVMAIINDELGDAVVKRFRPSTT